MLTKGMEKLYSLRYFAVEDPSCFNKPSYMVMDVEKNRVIELHINKLKGIKLESGHRTTSSLIDKPKTAVINNFL